MSQENELDGMELEQFNSYVEDLILAEKERKATGKSKARIERTIEDTVAKSTSLEMGEEEMMAAEAAADDIRAESELAKNDYQAEEFEADEIIGKPSKMLIVITGKYSRVIYGNAAEASRKLGINPTTVRQRCSGNKIDKEGNTWSYKENLG
jgi:hypothetical protein